MRRKQARAQTPEQREEAQVQPSTRNAFKLSLALALATGIAVWLGRFGW